MKVIAPGHTYELDNLKGSGSTTTLKFYMDLKIHGKGQMGPSTQEVLRAIIDRVQVLDSEKPWEGNAAIIQKAREMIALFETRALQLKVIKGQLDIENVTLGSDGHIKLGRD